MHFEPIAIVGQSCILPGALTPDELWQAVLSGRDLLSTVADDYWRLRPESILAAPGENAQDRTWSTRGGYVHGFEERFDPAGFALPADDVRRLDPLFHWVLHGVREALQSARIATPRPAQASPIGLVLGNLAYPTFGLVEYAESVWFESADPAPPGLRHRIDGGVDPRNRFAAGLPAHLAAQALNLGGQAFALDSACASSLYAIKLACDRLQHRRSDIMVAGAVNRTDDLFIHIGFCALQAMSRSGTSCPFSRTADGLVPAEGAAFVVLKRLADAVAADDEILGVIRGIGLSNDGTEGGFLSPSVSGQIRAMEAAYAMAGLSPAAISLLECHATGTPVGDAAELRSAQQIFADVGELPIGSLKSNLGHLITVAGAAGLLKVLGAFKHGVRPPMRTVTAPIDELVQSQFRVLQQPEPWPRWGEEPRRAAVSAFGFGGNNGHLIVEEWLPQATPVAANQVQPPPETQLAIVDLEVTAGAVAGRWKFERALRDGTCSKRTESIAVGLRGLRFPPNDLQQTLPQQLVMLEAARRLADRHASLDGRTTSVFVGMECDPEIARYSARWRIQHWAESWRAQGYIIDEEWLEAARGALIPGLQAAGVVGTMPNIPANRINTQLNLQGPSYTVAAGELSGLVALDCALDALRRDEIDAALVGAVDLSDEAVHRAAVAALPDEFQYESGDASVLLLVKRLADARRDGDPVLAVIESGEHIAERARVRPHVEILAGPNGAPISLAPQFGHSHAAAGLLHVAAAAVCLDRGFLPARVGGDDRRVIEAAVPWLENAPPEARVTAVAHAHQSGAVRLRAAGSPTDGIDAQHGTYALRIYAGADAHAVMDDLDAGVESTTGPARLVLIQRPGEDEDEIRIRAQAALQRLIQESTTETQSPRLLDKGVFWSSAPVDGEIAFVFPGAAAAYQGMGRELLLALPSLGHSIVEKFPVLAASGHWLAPDAGQPAPGPFAILQGCTLLSQIHALLTRGWLGLTPAAVLGVSSGETNAVFAMDAWHDMDAMFAEMDAQGMYSHEIAGDYATARRAWASMGVTDIDWAGWRILAPVAEVQAVVAGEPLVSLTMINAPEDCLIAGQADACRRVATRLGLGRAVENPAEIIAHHPVMRAWEEPWRQIHSRPTAAVPGVRFYSNATGTHYAPTRERVAAALTDQATGSVDFRRVVDAAWNDGVRIFVEHGPRNSCSNWIRAILGERQHLAVALDRPQNGVDQLLESVAMLVAAGVPLDTARLTRALSGPIGASDSPVTAGPTVSFPAHYAPVRLPAAERSAPKAESNAEHRPADMVSPPVPEPANRLSDMIPTHQSMDPAPVLPPVLADYPQDHKSLTSIEIPQLPTAGPSRAEAPRQSPDSSGDVNREEAPGAARMQEIVDLHAQVAAVHEQFLKQQAKALQLLAARARSTGFQPAEPAQASPLLPPPVPAAARPSTEPHATSGPAPITAPVRSTSIGKPASDSHADAGVFSATGRSFPGPKLDRAQLEHVASAKISEVLGDIFARQDAYERQVRMPMPPLLLADRVLGIDAEAGAYGTKGVIWTETDVTEDAWYLHHGHMPAGIMIESGQADLLLISYLGADFANRSERVYRLLGCEATFHGELPAVGDTLHFQIHVDGYAQQGEVRLFFFHYDCTVDGRLVLSVRHGQAGFFTDDELANSAGVIWDVHATELDPDARVDPPALPVTARAFSAEEIVAYSEGRITDCFGDHFWPAKTHVRTPTIAGGRMLLFDEVTAFEPSGGPWQRGYLRAEQHLTRDEWFFDGHFKNDPCMPGTLMLQGCLQTMAFYLTAMGYSLDRDGWRFEPIPEETYTLRARGQVTPGATSVIYELFVEEIHDGPVPMLYADLLCTVDGLRAFHCRRMGLRLRPAYPLESRMSLLEGAELADLQPARNARTPDHQYDPKSIAACAWGRPSAAFGALFARFDGPERCPRLPGPPYLYMTRITHINAAKGEPVAGGTLEAEYQIPADAWYFAENSSRTMPYAVLLEAALQPCGWFASYKGTVLHSDRELYFRNLDGTATQRREIFPEDGLLRTHVTNTSLSRLGAMTIVGFEVECFVGDEQVFEMTTSFGFFPREALADQAGLPVTEADRIQLAESSDFRRDLTGQPPRYCASLPALPGPMLLLLDRVTGYWPDGGAARLGRVRAEIDVDPDDWFFKCHFMGDPVQPGSLGIEAMIQALQFYMLEAGLARGMKRPRFQPLELGRAMTWKYRGQVLPSSRKVTVDLTVTSVEHADGAVSATADASLWVDGLRIYQATDLAMCIVEDSDPLRTGGERRLDPAVDTWLQDHCPTWTVPALAMMSMTDELAAGALRRQPGRKITGLRNVRVRRWLDFAGGAQTIRTVGRPVGARAAAMQLLVWETESRRYATVAEGTVRLEESWPLQEPIWPSVQAGKEMPNPYISGALFHGPAYQLLTSLTIGTSGATYTLDLDRSAVPPGVLNQGLLDAATHGIPHDALHLWSPQIPDDVAAYPVAINTATFYGPPPQSGGIRCEARFHGFQGGNVQFPVIRIQIVALHARGERVWAVMELVERLFPKGAIGQAAPEKRVAFLRDRRFTPGVGLTRADGHSTVVDIEDVAGSNWLPGTIPTVYGLDPALRDLATIARQVALREHAAQRLRRHPSVLVVEDGVAAGNEGDNAQSGDSAYAAAAGRPLNQVQMMVTRTKAGWQITDAPGSDPQRLNPECVRNFWRTRMDTGPTLVEDLTLALMRRFISSVDVENPVETARLHGRGVLYLANHQLDLESVLFVSLMAGLQGSLTAAMARQELNESWVGPFFEHAMHHPAMPATDLLMLIDRDSPKAVLTSMNAALDRVAEQATSLLIHVEGEHARQARQAVSVVSASLIDQAVNRGIPIVPVRFARGLPLTPVESPCAFPVDYGRQEIWLGTPIHAAELQSLSSASRRERILQALNGFQGRWQHEEPEAGAAAFAEQVKAWQAERGVSEVAAVLFCTLAETTMPCPETEWLLATLRGIAPPVPAPDGKRLAWLQTFAREMLGLAVGESLPNSPRT